jgi:hypothetical protein
MQEVYRLLANESTQIFGNVCEAIHPRQIGRNNFKYSLKRFSRGVPCSFGNNPTLKSCDVPRMKQCLSELTEGLFLFAITVLLVWGIYLILSGHRKTPNVIC